MRRLDMRTTYITLGTIATLAAALAACSGGGGGTTPALQGGGTPQSVPTQFGVNNSSGPTGTMSVTVKIPQSAGRASSAAIARIHALYGPKHADAHIRSMANTGASSLVRAMGARINANGTLTESSRRGAQYVSPSTYWMEVVVTNSTNSQPAIVDDTFYCSSTSCIGNVPVAVGTNYNVSLFLYDYECGYLLSAGTTSGVTVTASASPVPVAITLNPVVDYFDVETSASTPFINDASEAQNFTITVTPLDANSYIETTPGVLLNSSFQQITAVSLTVPVGSGDLTSGATQTLTVPTLSNASPTPYGMTSTSYHFTGTSGASQITWEANPVASGSPIVPNVANGTYGEGYQTSASYGELDEYPLSVGLVWTNPEGFPNPQGSPGYYPPGQAPDGPYAPSPNPSGGPNDYNYIPEFWQVSTNAWALEFPQLQDGQGTGALGVEEVANPTNSPFPIPFVGTINFTDNGGCAGVFSYPSPGPVAYSSPDPTYGLVITGSAYNFSSPSSSCVVTATDNSAYTRSATLQVYYDTSSLTIQNKARR